MRTTLKSLRKRGWKVKRIDQDNYEARKDGKVFSMYNTFKVTSNGEVIFASVE